MYVSIAWDPGTEDPHTLYGEPTLPVALYPGGSMGHNPPPLCPQTLPPVPGPWGPCLHARVHTRSHAGLPPVHLLRGPPCERAPQKGRQGQHGWNLGQQAGCARVGASCRAGLSARQRMEGGHESVHCPQSPDAGGRPGACVHACVHCGCAHGGMDLCVHAYE